MRPGLFLTIGDMQLNADFIVATYGCNAQKGPVRLYIQQRTGTIFAGADHLQYTAAKTPDQLAILELIGEPAAHFRTQWNAAGVALTGSAGGTG